MKNNKNNVVTVFGGTGFLGRHIVYALARTGATVRVASRIKQRGYFLRPAGVPGQIVPIFCDVHNDISVLAALQGATHAVNLIGVLFEKGKHQSFDKIHVDVPERIAKYAKEAQLKTFIHLSALGASKTAPSRYGRSKAEGETKALHTFGNSIILRPSIVFGSEDNFFNRFARMATFSALIPLPLIGGGEMKLQPVYVGDIAKAVEKIVTHTAPDYYAGQILELAGPKIYTFKELMDIILRITKKTVTFRKISFPVAKIMGFFGQMLPTPPLTVDQVRTFYKDNILSDNYNGFKDLGITPTPLESILPTYLARYSGKTIFSKVKKHA